MPEKYKPKMGLDIYGPMTPKSSLKYEDGTLKDKNF